MRIKSNIDSNQKEIVAAFRKMGAYVKHIHMVPNCCDILVAYQGWFIPVEIKDGSKPKSARKLTDGEQEFKDNILEKSVPLWVVESVNDVYKIMGYLKRNKSKINEILIQLANEAFTSTTLTKQEKQGAAWALQGVRSKLKEDIKDSNTWKELPFG